jgi:hypothetical protein
MFSHKSLPRVVLLITKSCFSRPDFALDKAIRKRRVSECELDLAKGKGVIPILESDVVLAIDNRLRGGTAC